MSRSIRLTAGIVILAAGGFAIATLARRPATPTPASRGRLVAALRAEPRSFNRLVARDRASLLLSQLLHARLVHLNHVTQEIEPALAERWTVSNDGRTYTFALRRGVTFSDGAPFTADDVLFTFRAIYDPKSGSPLADVFSADGKPLDYRATDAHTVVLTLPAPLAPLPRLLNSLPIMPAHKLKAALDAGRLREAWSVATPPAEMAGLGPFVLQSYLAGQRIELARNLRYWRQLDGAPANELPRLDRLTLRVLPDQQAELVAFEAGELDIMNSEVRPEDLAAMRRLAQAGRAQVAELGVAVDADSLWFNLGPARNGRPDAERPWLDANFRRAISHAVDRQQFVDAVMLGAGTPIYGPVTPGNRLWHDAAVPPAAYDVARARALFAAAGLTDRNGDGTLETRSGKPVRIELFTQRGHAMRERAASVLKADLEAVGLDVDVVTFDAPALGERLTKGAYDATYFGINASDVDPSTNLDYWLSSGSFHVWHPLQKVPATDWEREIDTLMREVTVLGDPAARKARFDRVQRLFAEHQPAIFFAAPRIVVATSPRVDHEQPGVLYPYVLWRADTLAAAPARPSGT
jgi:peptide/nickel transport system substrate-binding protein